MIDLGEVRWQDDCYDPYDKWPPKEEPDCGGCCDSQSMRAPWWLRMLGRAYVGCPYCCPGRVQAMLWNLRSRLPRRRRATGYYDEAPF